MLSMLGAINQFYRENQLEIQREGIRCAKMRGAYSKERMKKLSPEQIKEIKELMKSRETNATAIAKQYGIGWTLLYKVIKE